MLQEHLNLNVDCPEGATFSERSLGKSLDSYSLNVRDYLSEYWDLFDNSNIFSHNENFKYLWLGFFANTP